MENEHELRDCNIQSEICFVGALLRSPDLVVNYSNFMRSKYDFSDQATKFFYDSFETYYLTFSQTVDETKMNVFMSQDENLLYVTSCNIGIKKFNIIIILTSDIISNTQASQIIARTNLQSVSIFSIATANSNGIIRTQYIHIFQLVSSTCQSDIPSRKNI